MTNITGTGLWLSSDYVVNNSNAGAKEMYSAFPMFI